VKEGSHDQALRAAAGGDDVALAEVVRALGLTEAAMKSRLHRARNDLRQLLANEAVVPAGSGWH
jgi:DNA-directed RNA polymerase specialized sigma24 family protein